MRTRFLLIVGLVALICSCSVPSEPAVKSIPAPHLEKRGNVTQLIVEGEPYLAIAGELKNSTTSSIEYMTPIWPEIKRTGVNTVIAVVTWEQFEPREGEFNFKVIDNLIFSARENNYKLVLMWLASWKNGISSYNPSWVKADTNRFPLAKTPEGKSLPILCTLGENTLMADSKAYAALMKHLREIDAAEQTVIMMQMQNEVGIHGHTRDWHPDAVKTFNGPVPEQLISYLSKNYDNLLPETREAWDKMGKRTSGSWEEVFGKGDYTDEMFMAWNYATFMNKVTAAGKAEYALPTYVNAWIVQPEDKHPGDYPSGGPQAQNHDIWRAAAPNIDVLSPDIYLNDFPGILRMYARGGNPVFVPESRAGQNGAANAAFTFGEMGGMGYSAFGLDSHLKSETNDIFFEFYNKLRPMAKEVLKAQEEGRIAGVWVKGSNPTIVKDERTMGDVKVCFELVSAGFRNGGAPQLTGGAYNPNDIGYALIIREENGFTVLGSNIRVTFLPADGDGIIGLSKVTEGYYEEDGNWHEMRWLNGDEIQLRYDILSAIEEGFSGQGLNFGNPHPQILKVELFKYY